MPAKCRGMATRLSAAGKLVALILRSTVHGAPTTMGGLRQMSKKTKEVRKAAKAAKKAIRKQKKYDKEVDRVSVRPNSPFSS